MKTWEEHKKECSEIYDKKWKEMETFRSQCESIVRDWTIEKLQTEKGKWEQGGFIGGKEELLNRWIGEQSYYKPEKLADVMENHREWAEDEAEQTFKYQIIIAEITRRKDK